jgi:hypothetical protein
MNKRRNALIAVLVILLIVFNVVVFAINLPRTGAFWVADLFAMIAIFAQAGTHYLAYGNAETLMSKVYGFPIVQVGYYYLGGQLIVSLLFILLAQWVPIWLVLMISIIMGGAAAIGVIANDNVRDTIEKMDEYHDTQTSYMRKLYFRVKSIAEVAKDKELKDKLKAFVSEVEFSDAVSGPDLGQVEYHLWTCIHDLEESVHNNDIATALETLSKAEDLLHQRNNLCQLYKKRSINQGTPSDD